MCPKDHGFHFLQVGHNSTPRSKLLQYFPSDIAVLGTYCKACFTSWRLNISRTRLSRMLWPRDELRVGYVNEFRTKKVLAQTVMRRQCHMWPCAGHHQGEYGCEQQSNKSLVKHFNYPTSLLSSKVYTDKIRDGVPSPHCDIPLSVGIRKGEGIARGAPYNPTVQ